MARTLNILYLNHYAGTPALGMEYRPYYLAREWVRMGHQVTVVAASFSHVRAHQPCPGKETVDGITYHWLPTPGYQGNGLGRLKNIWSFLRQAWQMTPELLAHGQPDIVIASSTYPMDIWVARRMARLAGARWVYEVHDLWPASPMELSGMPWWHPFIVMCQKAENDAYRDADHVVSMLPNVAQHMASHGLDLKKLHIIPNGICPEEWNGPSQALPEGLASHLQSLRASGRTVVGYAGSHGTPNALDVLLDATALLREDHMAFVLVGDGHEKARLLQRVHSENLHNIQLFPPIAKSQIPTLLQQLDIAYIGWNRVPLYRFGIAPNKLMDYMMAGCAVLHSVDAGNDPVAEARCGLTVEPESPTAVAQGLRQLAEATPEQRQQMGANGKAHVLAHHAYPVLARRFLEAIA